MRGVPRLRRAITVLGEADGIIAAAPVYKAGPSGLFASFFQVLDNDMIIAKPVVLAATAGLDVTVLYAATIRPFDGAALRATLTVPDVVLVEPYLAGTSVPQVAAALADVPHRVLGLGVGLDELRRYGTPGEHQAAHGLDAAGLRASMTSFLAGAPALDRSRAAAGHPA